MHFSSQVAELTGKEGKERQAGGKEEEEEMLGSRELDVRKK